MTDAEKLLEELKAVLRLRARGDQALRLLKTLYRLKAEGKHLGETEFHPPHEDWSKAWREVRDLLAEEVPGTAPAFDPKTGEQQQICGSLPFFDGAGPCERAPGHPGQHHAKGRRWQ